VKRLLRLSLGLIAALTLSLGFTSVAGAQPVTVNIFGNYNTVTIIINNIVVLPGGTVVIVGQGFLPNSTVTVTVASDPYVAGTPLSDANGDFTLEFAAPTEVGQHTVTATDGTNTIVVPFEVAANGAVTTGTPIAVTPSGTLPYTGSDSSLPVAQGGAMLVAAGAVIVFTVRKRNQRLQRETVDISA
jgi:LPXTG-motif cell wall-anchored protein